MFYRLFAFLLCFIGSTALAQECVDYVSPEMKILDILPSPSFYHTYEVKVEGDLAYAVTSGLVQVVDISDPANMVLLGSIATGGSDALDVSNGYICITSYNNDIMFVDATDPMNLTHVATLPNISGARNVLANGDYFYIAGGYSGLHTIDATDRSNPFVSSWTDTAPVVFSLAINGNYLYTADSTSALCVFRLTDPAHPAFGGAVEGYSGRDLEIYGNYLYAPGFNGDLKISSIAIPAVPAFAEIMYFNGELRHVSQVGNILFAGNDPALNAFDLSIPTDPRYIGRMLYDDGFIGDMVPYGDVLVAPVEDHLLATFNVSQPVSTVPLKTWGIGGSALDIEFADSYYLLAMGSAGLQVRGYDEYPPLGNLDLPSFSFLHGVTLSGDLAYLAMDEPGLGIADISDPANPLLVGDVNSSGHARDVAVYTNASGTYAMVAITEQDLIKYDVTDPTNVMFKGLNSFPGQVYGVEMAGEHLLVADNSGFMYVMDLSSFPDQPQVVASLELPGPLTDFVVEGTLCYVAGNDYLGVVDVSDPSAPQFLGEAATNAPIVDISVSNGVAYCALEDLGMVVADVSNPANPVVRSNFPSQQSPGAVGVHGGQVYLCVGDLGLVFLPLQCEFAPSAVAMPEVATRYLGQAYPNPFNPRTTISYELPRAADIHLQVFDVAGKLVRTLVDGQRVEAGPRSVVWNGLDNTGRAVASGMYLYQLSTGEVTETRRMVLLR